MAIIITTAYVLSAAPDSNNPHIAWQTWVRGLLAPAITVSSEVASGPKDAVLRPDTFEYWEASALPATLTLDFGSAKDVDYIGIAAHTIGTNAATLKVEHSPDNAAWTQFASDLAPVTDAPIMLLDASISRRYWRVTLTGAGNVPRLAVLQIGKVLLVQRAIYAGHSPAVLARDTKLQQNMSDTGQFLGQYIRRQGVNGRISLKNLKAGWYRANFDLFVKSARQFPFFIAWRPVDYPLEVAYGWTDDNIQPSNMGIRDFMEVRFKFQGIGYAD